LAAFRAAYEAGRQLAGPSRPTAEQAMEALPAPFGLTPVQAGAIAFGSYPSGPVEAVRIQGAGGVMHQFLGFPELSVRPMLAAGG
jgi:hypothetical protein